MLQNGITEQNINSEPEDPLMEKAMEMLMTNVLQPKTQPVEHNSLEVSLDDSEIMEVINQVPKIAIKGFKKLSDETLGKLIKSKFPNADILIEDLAGDNNHYSVSIKSQTFNGLSRIQQHQLVYKSLDGLMDNELHAMQLKTKGTE